MRKAIGDLSAHAVREALAIGIISRAHFGCDREAGGHRQTNRRHAIKVRALAAEYILVAANGFVTVRNTTTEPKYILSHFCSMLGRPNDPPDNFITVMPNVFQHLNSAPMEIKTLKHVQGDDGCNAALPLNLRKICNLRYHITEPRQQPKAKGPLGSVFIIHHHFFEETVNRRT